MTPPPAQLLSGIRLGVGAGAWLAPGLTGKLFGLDPAANPQLAFMARLFGVRDVALAVGTGGTPPTARKVWWQVGIACDLLDAGAAYLAQRNGSIPRSAAVMAGATALAAAGLGAAALAADG
jgi:hypothetical protein